MEVAELNLTRTLAELKDKADEDGFWRARIETCEELFRLISPATPDAVFILDSEQTIFRAEWWIGNEDAVRSAAKDTAALLSRTNIIQLTKYEASVFDGEYAGVCFCVVLTPDLISEAVN